jgi:hypothetical protein
MKIGLLISVILIGLFVANQEVDRRRDRQTKAARYQDSKNGDCSSGGLRRQVKGEIKLKLYKEVEFSII